MCQRMYVLLRRYVILLFFVNSKSTTPQNVHPLVDFNDKLAVLNNDNSTVFC